MAIIDNDLSLESFASLPSKFCQPFYCRLILIGPKTPLSSEIYCVFSQLVIIFRFALPCSSRSRLAVESFFSVPVLSTVGSGSILRFLFVSPGLLATHSESLLVFSCFSSAFDRASLFGACVPRNLFFLTPVVCRGSCLTGLRPPGSLALLPLWTSWLSNPPDSVASGTLALWLLLRFGPLCLVLGFCAFCLFSEKNFTTRSRCALSMLGLAALSLLATLGLAARSILAMLGLAALSLLATLVLAAMVCDSPILLATFFGSQMG